jgi:hypothetical protein
MLAIMRKKIEECFTLPSNGLENYEHFTFIKLRNSLFYSLTLLQARVSSWGKLSGINFPPNSFTQLNSMRKWLNIYIYIYIVAIVCWLYKRKLKHSNWCLVVKREWAKDREREIVECQMEFIIFFLLLCVQCEINLKETFDVHFVFSLSLSHEKKNK